MSNTFDNRSLRDLSKNMKKAYIQSNCAVYFFPTHTHTDDSDRAAI